MDINLVLNILQILLYVILGGLAIWFKQSDKLKGKVTEYINTAESMYVDTTKAGGKRFEWVVDSLYNLLPTAIRGIIPKSWIESIVQSVFDQMKDFAKKNLDNAVQAIETKLDQEEPDESEEDKEIENDK